MNIYWYIVSALSLAVFTCGYISAVYEIKKQDYESWEHYHQCYTLDTKRLFSCLEYNPLEIIDRLAKKAGIKSPEIIFPEYDEETNVFVLQGEEGPYLVISPVLIGDLNEKQFEGVAAHEIGHIVSGRRGLNWLYFHNGFLECFKISLLGIALLFVSSPLHPSLAITQIWLTILFGVLSMLCLIMMGHIIRLSEYEADHFAIILSSEPEAFIELLDIFFGRDLSFCSESTIEKISSIILQTHPQLQKEQRD